MLCLINFMCCPLTIIALEVGQHIHTTVDLECMMPSSHSAELISMFRTHPATAALLLSNVSCSLASIVG